MIGRGDIGTTHQLLGVADTTSPIENQSSTKVEGIYRHTRSRASSLEFSYANTPSYNKRLGVSRNNKYLSVYASSKIFISSLLNRGVSPLM